MGLQNDALAEAPPILVIFVHEETRSMVYSDPLTNAERKFMSLTKIHGFFAASLPPAQRIMAMATVVQFLRTSVKFSFRIGSREADNETVADAALRWLDASATNRMTPESWQEIEQALVDNDGTNDFLDLGSVDTDVAAVAAAAQATSSVPDGVASSGKRCRRDDLEEELQQVQKRVKRNHEFDVRRGKGQGVKNTNAKLYTPLIRSRALEYSNIDTGNKKRNDDMKHAIAFEILIELARKGGRILDEDNETVLGNEKALKKVMNALKDSGRAMKKRGEDRESPVDQLVPFFPDHVSSHRVSSNRGGALLDSPRADTIEPESYFDGHGSPSEGDALHYFSSYWLRRRH